MDTEIEIDVLEIEKYSKSVAQAAKVLERTQARTLVHLYYSNQRSRIAMGNRIIAFKKDGKATEVLDFMMNQFVLIEKYTSGLLNQYAKANYMGQWSSQICGIGPVLSAGLLAYVNLDIAQTAGDVWAYAGLAPGQVRRKGVQVNHNPTFKTITWKIGESFVKNAHREHDIYGKVIKERRAYEDAKNQAGEYADQAKKILQEKNFEDKTTSVYKEYAAGRLPPAHLHSRCKRYAVKLFLAHYFEEAWEHRFGSSAPLPYPIVHMGHAHVIERPNVSVG